MNVFWVILVEELVTVRKVGGSLMVVVPSSVVSELKIKSEDKLKVDFKKLKLDFFGKYKGVGEFTLEDRLDERED